MTPAERARIEHWLSGAPSLGAWTTTKREAIAALLAAYDAARADVARLRAVLAGLPSKAIHTVTLVNRDGSNRREAAALLVETLQPIIDAALAAKEGDRDRR